MIQFVQHVLTDQGDAYPFELAQIIAELELSLPKSKLTRENFPRYIHTLLPKSDEVVRLFMLFM